MKSALILILLVITDSALTDGNTTDGYAKLKQDFSRFKFPGDEDDTGTTTPPPTNIPPPPPPSNDKKPRNESVIDFFLTNQKTTKLSYEEDNDYWIANFDGTCKTIIIIPGYLTGKLKVFDDLIDAYMKLDECYNLIFCHWPSSYDPDYISAAQSTYDVGDIIGQHILDWFGKGILQGYIELIGHGLGAHIAGCAGRTTSVVLPVDVITALDPVAEFFTDGYLAFEDFKITPTDATKVVCLHTSAGSMGTAKECGKYDFFANNGSKQPGIIFDHNGKRKSWGYVFVIIKVKFVGYYSHMMALAYCIESLSSPAFVAHGPLGFPTTRFGKMAKTSPPGKYYFKTNTKPPYGRN